ncbi:MAG: hypothetical protein K2K73_03150, partial [Ureaplasma sp.]|nr:hypothetical protein [Ureaplasma sp.]
MSKSIKKKVISLISGLAILGGTVGSGIALANLSSYNKNVISLKYDDLVILRKNLINIWLSKKITADDFQKLYDTSAQTIVEQINTEYAKLSSTPFPFQLSLKREGEIFSLILKPNSTDRFSLFKPENTNNDVELLNNNIVFNNIRLFASIKFNNDILTDLRNKINNYIFDNKFTSDEFINNSLSDQNKLNDFKNKIQKWTNDLLVASSMQNITLSNINNKLSLVITHIDEYSYEIDGESKYFDKQTDSLIFDDLEFFTNISIDELLLEQLRQNIQDYIDLFQNRFTISEFNQHCTTETFKEFIAEKLNINKNLISSI